MKAKRKDSSNHILRVGESQRENGTYAYRWTDDKGKRRTVYAPTLPELRAKEDEVAKEIERRKSAPNYSDITFAELYQRMIDMKRGHVKETTIVNYQYLYQGAYTPLADRKVVDITKAELRDFVTNLSNSNKYSMAYLNRVCYVLHLVFEIALDDEIIAANPAHGLKKRFAQTRSYLETADIEETKVQTLSEEEQKIFISALDHSYNMPMYVLGVTLLGTGLRIAEALGLTWDDIDFDAGVIKVRRQLYDNNSGHKGYAIGTPKTKSGLRDIPIIDEVKNVLQRLKKRQEFGRKSTFAIDGITNFVFTANDGTPIKYNAVVYHFAKVVAEYNSWNQDRPLPDVKPHMLRHTFCTRLCEQGVSVKVIEKVMGHSNINTTLDIYTEVTSKFQSDEIRKVKLDFIKEDA